MPEYSLTTLQQLLFHILQQLYGDLGHAYGAHHLTFSLTLLICKIILIKRPFFHTQTDSNLTNALWLALITASHLEHKNYTYTSNMLGMLQKPEPEYSSHCSFLSFEGRTTKQKIQQNPYGVSTPIASTVHFLQQFKGHRRWTVSGQLPSRSVTGCMQS